MGGPFAGLEKWVYLFVVERVVSPLGLLAIVVQPPWKAGVGGGGEMAGEDTLRLDWGGTGGGGDEGIEPLDPGRSEISEGASIVGDSERCLWILG